MAPHRLARHGLDLCELVNAFVDREGAAHRGDQDADDERPEVAFDGPPERVLFSRAPLGQPHPHDEEHLVAGVRHAVDGFGEHGRAAGHRRHGELAAGDQEVRGRASDDDPRGIR